MLDNLTDDKVQQMVMIKTSKQYLSRLERVLKQKAGQHDKFLRYVQFWLQLAHGCIKY